MGHRPGRQLTVRHRLHRVALVAIVAGCSAGDPPPGRDSADSATVVDTLAAPRSWSVPPRFDYLACSPAVLRRGDTLSLRMTRPHAASFMAIGPDETPYIVVFHGEGDRDRGARTSLMPPDSFVNVEHLQIPTSTFRAGVWVFGRDTNELLFRQPGFYRLIVGSDLETDGPSYAECRVRLAP